ncbi:MAG: hypothetical protein Q7R79_03570 [bacterium]|nr:hypothetical protein [bacterium]
MAKKNLLTVFLITGVLAGCAQAPTTPKNVFQIPERSLAAPTNPEPSPDLGEYQGDGCGDMSEATPSVQPSASPTVEPSADPTVEPIVEPTEEPYVPYDPPPPDKVIVSYFLKGKDVTINGDVVSYPGSLYPWYDPVLILQFGKMPYHAGWDQYIYQGTDFTVQRLKGSVASTVASTGYWINPSTYVILLEESLYSEFNIIPSWGPYIGLETAEVNNIAKTGHGTLRPNLN